MNILKKIAIGAALCTAVASAQQMVVTAVVGPLATVQTLGFAIPAEALLTGGAAADPDKESPTIGWFRVLTNLESWDVKITAVNGGKLLKTTDKTAGIKTVAADGSTDVVTDGALGDDDNIFVCAVAQNGTQITGCETTGIVLGDVALDVSADVFLTGGTTATPVTATEKSDLEFVIKSNIGGAEITSLFGAYSETFIITLVGAY